MLFAQTQRSSLKTFSVSFRKHILKVQSAETQRFSLPGRHKHWANGKQEKNWIMNI